MAQRMTYANWLEEMLVLGISTQMIHCDVPPTDTVLRLIDKWGIERWERFAEQLESRFNSNARGCCKCRVFCQS